MWRRGIDALEPPDLHPTAQIRSQRLTLPEPSVFISRTTIKRAKLYLLCGRSRRPRIRRPQLAIRRGIHLSNHRRWSENWRHTTLLHHISIGLQPGEKDANYYVDPWGRRCWHSDPHVGDRWENVSDNRGPLGRVNTVDACGSQVARRELRFGASRSGNQHRMQDKIFLFLVFFSICIF